MKHIRITEKSLTSERVLFDEDFSKLLMVTDSSIGIVDFDNLEDIFNAIDIITTAYFLRRMRDDVSRKDVFYMKLILTTQMLMSIMDDILDEDTTKEFENASTDLARTLAVIAREASKDCSYMETIDLSELDTLIGEELIRELEEYERRQDEE